MKILLVEDDVKLSEHLTTNLRDEGFQISSALSETELRERIASNERTDLVILDRLLGTTDAKTYVPQMKVKWPHVPILILSAISTPNERMELLNKGADDYLGKPFSTGELVARVRALLRRTSGKNSPYLQVGDLVIDTMKRVIIFGDSSLLLPTKEFFLLRTLCQEPGRVWRKEDLLDQIWGQTSEVDTNVVEATITNVRKKLSDLGVSVLIKNMRNAGYWVEA